MVTSSFVVVVFWVIADAYGLVGRCPSTVVELMHFCSHFAKSANLMACEAKVLYWKSYTNDRD